MCQDAVHITRIDGTTVAGCVDLHRIVVLLDPRLCHHRSVVALRGLFLAVFVFVCV